jgi:hypothetical protein
MSDDEASPLPFVVMTEVGDRATAFTEGLRGLSRRRGLRTRAGLVVHSGAGSASPHAEHGPERRPSSGSASAARCSLATKPSPLPMEQTHHPSG